MNLSQLYYFKKLSELLHYTNAAKELYITQPTLSEAISSLESELGICLFQKEGRNIKLTKYGVEFAQYVSEFIQYLETGMALAKEKGGDLAGRVEVCSITTILDDYLPRMSLKFQREISERTDIVMFEGTTEEIISGVKKGLFDVGFCTKVCGEPELEFIPVLSQKVIALVNEQHPYAGRKEMTLAELADYPVITYRDDMQIGKDMKKLIQDYTLNLQCNFMGESAIGGYVSVHNAIGLLAETSVLAEFPGLIRIPFTDVPENYRQVHMVFSKKNYMSKPTERFIDFIADSVGIPVKRRSREGSPKLRAALPV
jgi:DNA-binding transcriptional LysR family regulator